MMAHVREIVITLVIVLVVFFAFHTALQSFRVDGSSMETSFHHGQYLLVNKLVYRFGSPDRGDVIIFKRPGGGSTPYVKRVVGLPGERVEVKDGGVFINGCLLEEPDYIPPTVQGSGTVVLQEDEYYVLGDNRAHSSDSRFWGAVPEENIIGKVWFSYWPVGHWGFSPSYAASLEG